MNAKILKLAPEQDNMLPAGICWVAPVGPIVQRGGEFVLGKECRSYDEMLAVVKQITDELNQVLAQASARFGNR